MNSEVEALEQIVILLRDVRAELDELLRTLTEVRGGTTDGSTGDPRLDTPPSPEPTRLETSPSSPQPTAPPNVVALDPYSRKVPCA